MTPSLDTDLSGRSALRLKARRVAEHGDSASFFLTRPEGGELPPFAAGQWIDVAAPNGEVRSYVLSAFSRMPRSYRITVLRQRDGASVSSFLVDAFESGRELSVSGPYGEDLLGDGSRPLVVVSRGIGSVAVVALAEALAQQARHRPCTFVLAVHSAGDILLGAKITSLRAELRDATFRILVDDPADDEGPGRHGERVDDLSPESVAARLPAAADADFILCGARDFVMPLATLLRGRGMAAERVRTLSFGPLSVEHSVVERVSIKDLDFTPRTVDFLRSRRSGTWNEEAGTLLDFALSQGLELPFSCRTGMCGTCAQNLRSGRVAKVRATSARAADGKVLLCSTIPASDVALDI